MVPVMRPRHGSLIKVVGVSVHDPCHTCSMTSTLNEQSRITMPRPVDMEPPLQYSSSSTRMTFRRLVVALSSQHNNDSHVRQIRAADLGTATSIRRQVTAEDDQAVVLLDLEFLIAPTARAARITYAGLADAGDPVTSTVRYIGTPSGLACLIADIGAAHVADGVTLTDLGDSESADLFVTETIAVLVRDGTLDIETAEALRTAAIS